MSSSHAYFDAVQDWYARVRLARPFLKWAGGKQPFLLRFGALFPEFRGRYIEPFLGSGSVFFYNTRTQRRPFESILGDTNLQLIRSFVAIREDPIAVSERLETHQVAFQAAPDKAQYYNLIRDVYNSHLPKVDAADFIFLNRTGWNGLYRLNQAGRYNVPYGNPKSTRVVPQLDDLINIAAALLQADLRATTWENTLSLAEPDDFVFLDPPYYSDIAGASAKYSKIAFTMRDHGHLARSLQLLDGRNVNFILTSSGEAEMSALYSSHGFNVDTVEVPRFINSRTDLRTPVKELIVTSRAFRQAAGDQVRQAFLEST